MGMGKAGLDYHARQLGFHDYETWAAWNAHRSASLRQGQTAAAPDQQNWLQSLVSRIPVHPAYIFKRISDRFGQATGQQP